MTMKLTIKNEDAARTARVHQRELAIDATGKHTGACSEPTPPTDIPPGGEASFYIYTNRDLRVEEV